MRRADKAGRVGGALRRARGRRAWGSWGWGTYRQQALYGVKADRVRGAGQAGMAHQQVVLRRKVVALQPVRRQVAAADGCHQLVERPHFRRSAARHPCYAPVLAGVELPCC